MKYRQEHNKGGSWPLRAAVSRTRRKAVKVTLPETPQMTVKRLATYVLELEGAEMLIILSALNQLPFSFANETLIQKVEQQVYHPKEVKRETDI